MYVPCTLYGSQCSSDLLSLLLAMRRNVLGWLYLNGTCIPYELLEELPTAVALQGINLGERPFNTAPGPVFNPGTGFGNRPNTGFVNNSQNFANSAQGFASSGPLNLGPAPGGLGGSMNNMNPVNMGSVPNSGINQYHSVYNMSPNTIPLGAGRPLLNSGLGF